MPQPTRSQVHVNRPLTNMSVAFLQNADGFVARKIFKAIPVEKKSDLYFTYPKGQWYTDEMEERAPGTESSGSGYAVSTDSYACKVFAHHKDVADQIRSNQDDPLDQDREAAEFLTQKWLISQERKFVSHFFTTSIWTGSTTGGDITPGTLWDAASGNPVRDVKVQATAMAKKTGGYRPNILLVTRDVHDQITENADIKDRIKYVERITGKTFTMQAMADLFGIEQYLISDAVYNSAKEGATASMSYIATAKSAALYYAAPNVGLMTPSAGYTFDWTGYTGSGAQGQAISNFRMDNLKSDRFELEAAYDMKVVAADLGVYFSNVIS